MADEKSIVKQAEKELTEKLIPLARKTAQSLEKEGVSNSNQFKVFTTLVEYFLEERRKARNSQVVKTPDGKAYLRLKEEAGEVWIPLWSKQCP